MLWFKSKKDYIAAQEFKDEDSESLLSSSEKSQPAIQPSRLQRWNWIFALLFSNMATAVIVLHAFWIWTPSLDSQCAAYTSSYSPILKDVQVEYQTVRYNGSFFHETIYRQDPSPEVDQAWQDLGVDYRALRIPAEEAERSGITKNHVKISDKYGGGYPANVQGLHNLHCLNLVRQTTHWNFDYYKALGKGAFVNNDSIVKTHATHCLDMIRQRLICEADTGVLGQVWWAESETAPPHAFVDFNVQHRCKNYDAIRSWAEERQLPSPENTPKDYLQFPTGHVLSAIP